MHITIETLWKQGKNKSEISRIIKHDWKTVNKTIKALEAGKYPEKKPHPRRLDEYKDKILEYIGNDLSGRRIYEELCHHGITTTYSSVKDYISKIKKRENLCIRIHTAPGEEAQVDFGYIGLTLDDCGKRRKTWVFNMKLSYSRLDYYEKVYDQKVETFIQSHMHAFKYFNGIPKYVKIDNLKSAVLEANFYETGYQMLYKQFADYYGFSPLPCRIRQPQEKGKVESGIKYVKHNFFAGRSFKDGSDLDRQLKNWLDKTCNNRIHGTTRKIPLEIFCHEESHALKPLPEKAFIIPSVGQRKVYHDCHIFFDYNYYSVPFEYVGKSVNIEAIEHLVRISYNDKQIAVHTRHPGKGEFITDKNHYPPYKDHRSTEYQESYQVKMKGIGVNAEQLFFYIIKSCSYEWNRTICGILSLKKEYPDDIIDKSCKRALYYGIKNFSAIKNICKSGAYNQPLEFNPEVYNAIY